MKFYKFILSLALVSMIASCGSDPDSKMVGKWKLSSMSIERADGGETPEENKARIQEFADKMVEEGVVYEFNEDGSFTETRKGVKEKEGKYKAVELEGQEGLTVALMSNEDAEEAFVSKLTITSMSDTEFSTESNDGEIKLVSKYTKQ